MSPIIDPGFPVAAFALRFEIFATVANRVDAGCHYDI
jgi:hypothetical protein